MFVGARGHLGDTFALETDTIYLREVVLPTAGTLYRANMWLSGRGGGLGPATVRPVLYSRPGNVRLAVGDEVTIAAGTLGDYVALTFPTFPVLAAGTYALGIQVGGPAHTLESAYDELAVPRVHNGRTTVAAPGAPVVVNGPRPVLSIKVAALDSNAQPVAVGSSTIDVATPNAVLLYPGRSMSFGSVDLADLYVDATVAGDGIAYVFTELASPGLAVAATYAGGAPSSISPAANGLGLAVYATPSVAWVAPVANLTEEYIAELPWPEAQTIFSSQGTLANSGRLVRASWFGTDFYPAIGAYAIVQKGSAFESLLGERIKVSYGNRAVWVYVVDVADTDDQMALSRQAFLRLGPLALDHVDALLEVIAA